MTTPDLTPIQAADVAAVWQTLTPVHVDNDVYIHIAQLHEAAATILFPEGVTSEGDYEQVTKAASKLAFEHSYAGETQLRPPQVAFNASGNYLRKQPTLNPELLTAKSLGKPRQHRYQPIEYYPVNVIERHIARKLHGTDRVERNIAHLIATQIELAMLATGWTKSAESYTRPLLPNLKQLHPQLVAWLQKQQTAVYREALLRQATKIAYGREYPVDESLRADIRKLFQPLLDALPAALKAARFQTTLDAGAYHPRPLEISAETATQFRAALNTLETSATHFGNVLPSKAVWESIATICNTTPQQLTVQQRQQLDTDFVRPWLSANGYQREQQWIRGSERQPRQQAGIHAFRPICHIKTDNSHMIGLGRGDSQALPVYAPLCILDETTHVIVCLQMIGNPQSVKANWARLMSSYQSPVQIEGVTIRQRGMKEHLIFKRQLPLDQVEWVLLHKQASMKTIQPDKLFYVLDDGKAAIPKAFFPLLDAVLAIPLQSQWSGYLWSSGRTNGQIVTANSVTHGQMAWRINPKADLWERIIKQGFETGELALTQKGEAIRPQPSTPCTDTDNIPIEYGEDGIEGGKTMRPQLPTPWIDADIISVYTVDDGIEDGVLFDVATLNKNNGLPTVLVPFNPTFPLGRLIVAVGALELAEQGVDLSVALQRHARGDWGDIDPVDIASNNHALKHEGILRSSYQQLVTEDDGDGEDRTYTVKLWIITECDRSVTTLLKPSEY